MLDRTHRFHGLGSLRFAYSRGQTVRGPLLSLKYARNTRRTDWRAAVVVSRKVHKSAVVRNRIRRRIFEIIRTELQDFAEPYDLVFITYSDQLAALTSSQLRSQIISHLQSSGILSGNRTTPR